MLARRWWAERWSQQALAQVAAERDAALGEVERLRAALGAVDWVLGPNSQHGTSISAARAARDIVREALSSECPK